MNQKTAIDFLIQQSKYSKKNTYSLPIEATGDDKTPYKSLINYIWQKSSRSHFRYSTPLHEWYTPSRVTKEISDFYKTLSKKPTVLDFYAGSGNFIDIYKTSVQKTAESFYSISVFSSNQEKEAVEHVAAKTQQIVETILNEKIFTQAQLDALKTEIFDRIDQAILSTKKPAKWVKLRDHIISLIVTVVFWLLPSPINKDVIPTDELIEQSATVKRLENMIKRDHILKVVKKNFWLHRSPLYSSPKIFMLKKGAVVEIIDTNRSWAKIKFLDVQKLPVQGWLPVEVLAKVY